MGDVKAWLAEALMVTFRAMSVNLTATFTVMFCWILELTAMPRM